MLNHPFALPYLEVSGLSAPRASSPHPRSHGRARAARPSLASRFAGPFRVAAGLVRRVASWRERRRTIRRLESLDNRLLADIGITRADIPDVAGGVFVREVPAPFVAWVQPRQILTGIDGRRPAANDEGTEAAA